jgi:hypothetical protein
MDEFLFFEQPFWINTYEDLYRRYKKTIILPTDQQDEELKEEMKKVNMDFKKQYGSYAFYHFVDSLEE